MAKFYNITKETEGNKVSYPELINVYYTALMIFLVFTAGNELSKGLLGGFHKEWILYVILWGSMVIQTTFAYKHIKEIQSQKYNKWAFLSDSLDICIFIYVCSQIGNTCNAHDHEFVDMDTYKHITIPFLILSVNQFCWYILVREKEYTAAVFRLVLLFGVMLSATILDSYIHGFWLLLMIVLGNVIIMVYLRYKNCVPDFLKRRFSKWWRELKKTDIVTKFLKKLAEKESRNHEEIIIGIEEKNDNIENDGI